MTSPHSYVEPNPNASSLPVELAGQKQQQKSDDGGQSDQGNKRRQQRQDIDTPSPGTNEPDGLPAYEDPPEPTQPRYPFPPPIRSNNPLDPNDPLNYIREPSERPRPNIRDPWLRAPLVPIRH